MNKFINILTVSLFVIFTLTCIAQDANKFTYDSKGKRDPFYPLEQVKTDDGVKAVKEVLSSKEKLKQKGIIVSSIVWDPNKPAILINDDILEVGDTIQGVIIRAIEQDYVVFEIDGELVEVPMV